MAVKIAGVVLILLAGLGAGELKKREWTQHRLILEELLRFIEFLQVELLYHEHLLPDLLAEWQRQCTRKELGIFLEAWRSHCLGGATGAEIEATFSALNLSEAEEHQLRLLVESLGHSGLAEQERLLQLFASQTQNLLLTCRQEGAQLSRLWRYCGLFSAAVLAILLL